MRKSNQVAHTTDEYLGKAAMTILEKGSSGSAWIVLNKETEPYEMQNELTGANMIKNKPQ